MVAVFLLDDGKPGAADAMLNICLAALNRENDKYAGCAAQEAAEGDGDAGS